MFRIMIEELLQHARQLGGLEHEIGNLIEDERAGPLRLERALGDARQQRPPICEAHTIEPPELRRERGDELPALHLRR
jgi:hypothetical protein